MPEAEAKAVADRFWSCEWVWEWEWDRTRYGYGNADRILSVRTAFRWRTSRGSLAIY